MFCLGDKSVMPCVKMHYKHEKYIPSAGSYWFLPGGEYTGLLPELSREENSVINTDR